LRVNKNGWLNTNHHIEGENWKKLLFPDISNAKPAVLKQLSLRGCVAEKNGVISAFATVGISPQSYNGYLDYGCNQECDYMLKK
jgi:hypothetical protein